MPKRCIFFGGIYFKFHCYKQSNTFSFLFVIHLLFKETSLKLFICEFLYISMLILNFDIGWWEHPTYPIVTFFHISSEGLGYTMMTKLHIFIKVYNTNRQFILHRSAWTIFKSDNMRMNNQRVYCICTSCSFNTGIDSRVILEQPYAIHLWQKIRYKISNHFTNYRKFISYILHGLRRIRLHFTRLVGQGAELFKHIHCK